MLLYYITDRLQFSGTDTERRSLLLRKISDAARCGIDFVQLREKDLPTGELENLAQQAMQLVRSNSRVSREGERCTHVLVNSRSDVAIAAGADGVHLRSEDISPSTARSLWEKSSRQQNHETFPLIAVSCHTEVEVARAAADGADFAVFAPVFEKQGLAINAAGLESLRLACRYDIPVLALGGVTLENIPACLNAGAAGIAGIRLFQENDIGEVVSRLRGNHA